MRQTLTLRPRRLGQLRDQLRPLHRINSECVECPSTSIADPSAGVAAEEKACCTVGRSNEAGTVEGGGICPL